MVAAAAMTDLVYRRRGARKQHQQEAISKVNLIIRLAFHEIVQDSPLQIGNTKFAIAHKEPEQEKKDQPNNPPMLRRLGLVVLFKIRLCSPRQESFTGMEPFCLVCWVVAAE